MGQHRGANFVGEPLRVIINLRVEGASGGSGPTSDTPYRARFPYVGRTRA